MKLTVGERLEGAGPAHQPGGYVVTSVVRETPWHGLYAGKKIFYNFDFTAKRVRETDEVEWLDVFLRTNHYPVLDDAMYVQQRRTLARAEVRAILGNRHSNLWPEPLDLLEVENTRDPFLFSSENLRANEPIAVYARPQGRFTPEWQRQVLPITSILSVLAELLEFIKQAHAEGLLLLGLGPPALLIDGSDRVHYVGTELVLSQQSALLKETTPTALWSRLFPADRFARGYAAPECFDPAQRPDARSDLYAWSALAFSLLSGIDLANLADEQGRPWVVLTDGHWSQLERTLTQLPGNSVSGWAEQLGVGPRTLLEAWPRKLLHVFRLLLSPDPSRRPRSIADLVGWLADPPPPPIAGLIALHTGPDAATLLLDCTGIEADLEMAIQCSRGAAAQLPSEGATVVEGPLRPVVDIHALPLTTDPIYYTAFTRRDFAGRRAFSPGVSAELWQPTDVNLRNWVESHATGMIDGQEMPMPVAMVLRALDPDAVTDSLLRSPIVGVREWSLRRLEQTLQERGYTDALAALVWRYVRDPNVEVRQTAAGILWSFHPSKMDSLLIGLVEALETPPVDAPPPIHHFLRRLQLPESRIRFVLQHLETRRPTECPICKKVLTLGERGMHLQTEHGYLLFQGDVLPAEAVFHRLWERAFEKPDRQAHEELVGMYLNLPDSRRDQDAAIDRYVADLERYLEGGMSELPSGARGNHHVPVALTYIAVTAFQTNVRNSRSFLPIARALLRSAAKQVHELGIQTVLPFFQDQLRVRSSVDDLRRLLAEVCVDLDQTDLQVELCRQLAQLGVDQTLVSACVADLQEERLVVCPDCRSQVRARDLEMHLRRAHQVFQFRGARTTYVDTREAILHAVCTPPPDRGAWRSLESLAADKHPDEVDRYLVVWLLQYVKDANAEARGLNLGALAETVVAGDAAGRLLPLFAGPNKNTSWELLGQRIALEICARAALAPTSIVLVLPFLDQKELPRRSRENAALALLRSAGKDRSLAAEILRAYVAQTSKKRGVEKLENLEQRFGHSPAIDAITRELDDEIRMSCPRCPTELRKKDMVEHLWMQHRLVLDGQRVREPWRVIEDWVVDYGLEKDPQVLERCRELAMQDDPQSGLARLQRLLYRNGFRDRELLSDLRAHVKQHYATLCPNCCAAVDIEPPPAIEPLQLEANRLEGFGYHLEVSDHGLAPSLRIESPNVILYRGREPGRSLTRVGAVLGLIGPFIVGTFLILNWILGDEVALEVLGTMAAGVSLVFSGLLYLIWFNPPPARERLVSAAWNLLVPEMLDEEMTRREWSFLNGLVVITDENPPRRLDPDLLVESCERASEAARDEPVATASLAKLGRLCLAEMAHGEKDPFPFLLMLASECFKGKTPLSILDNLLKNFHGRERTAWSNDDLHRLPILIAQRAFEADVDIDDWLNLGRVFPVAGAVLNLEQRWHWLQFFALWTQRHHKPWDDAGPALTLFELAGSPRDYEDVLTHYPDVLFYVPRSNIVVGTKGVWIEGVCVTSFQPGADVSMQKISGECELTIGAVKIRCSENPRAYLDDIKRWLRYYFQEFLPTVASVARPLLESRHRMWQLSKTTCPECGKSLVPCVGDLGLALR